MGLATHTIGYLERRSFSFDVSAWEFYLPLLKGALGVVASARYCHKDSDELVQLIERCRISIIHFVPSMLHVSLQHGNCSMRSTV